MPELVIIAGPNGSGKSTLTDAGRLEEYGITFPRERYINPDWIARDLQAMMPDASLETTYRDAFNRARALRQDYREQGVSYAFETVFSHPSSILDIVKARNAGYRVTFIFVATEHAEINVARVAGRVQQGGHHVDEDKIRSRYGRSYRYLPRAVEEAAVALVFDATEERQTRLCFQKRNFVTIRDAPSFLDQRLISVLKARSRERNEIGSQFPNLILPDEGVGVYSGAIRCVRSQFVAQELPDGACLLHDFLLCNHDPAQTAYLTESVITVISYADGLWRPAPFE